MYICLTDDAEVILLGTGRTHIGRAHPFWRVFPPISEKRILEWFQKAALQKIWMRLIIRGLKQSCEDESRSGSMVQPSAPKREHPALPKIKFINFFYVCGSFLPSVIGIRIANRIRIRI